MEIVTVLISSTLAILVSLLTTFLYDRYGFVFFSKKRERDAIQSGPQLEVSETPTDEWSIRKKDTINYRLLVQSQKSHKDQDNEVLICDFQLLDEKFVGLDATNILRIRIVNNTDDGICIKNLIFPSRPAPNISSWVHSSIDPNTNISIYISTVGRPDEIQILYKGYILTYELKSLPTGYIRANKAKRTKQN